ncbi:MAG TPA: MarR family transcriptional regulator [Amnibacterium sp.]|nr:MarR family transcriptional regulator [Amnibacterium sp.]
MDTQDSPLRASRALLAIVARSLAPVLEEVTLPQFRVLVLLATRGPTRVGNLAAQLEVHPSTFSRALDRLEAAGWVARSANADSRREVLVSITAAGSTLVGDVTAKRRAELDRVVAALPAGERDQVLRALAVFADAAGEPAASDLLVLGM